MFVEYEITLKITWIDTSPLKFRRFVQQPKFIPYLKKMRTSQEFGKDIC